MLAVMCEVHIKGITEKKNCKRKNLDNSTGFPVRISKGKKERERNKEKRS